MEQPNLSYIQSMSAGDKEFEQNLIQIIKVELAQEKLIYIKNVNDKDYLSTADNVHKLKHKIGILGLEKSYAVAVAFENELKQGKAKLRHKFESILEVMTNYIEQL